MDTIEVLKKYFGYTSLRNGQEEIIESILSGRHTLGIMPTGAGKSLCYQLPAIMMEGITIVISPLISLMADQVKALIEIGVRGAYINSSLTERQIAKALENAAAGMYKIIYAAPERLETQDFLNFAMNGKISMVTIDEAHCVSQWGQDFRPSYTKIADFIMRLKTCPVVSAFTATATENVRNDIVNFLRLRDPYIKITGFDRKNLFFKVEHINRAIDKNVRILDYISQHRNESGIIYCATRKNTDNVWRLLNENGIKAGRYHGGMSSEERKTNQDEFIYDIRSVIVATNAFGMGIDKSNVRYVIHYNMPQSIENYYQEAGRAGRDGEQSECILIYSPQDVVINRFLLESKTYEPEMTYYEINNIKANDEIRLKKMIQYSTTTNCLRNYILEYFGDGNGEKCGSCGNCTAEFDEIDATQMCRHIIACIDEMDGRYGLRAVLDTLLGENTMRTEKYGLDRLSCFSKYSKEDKEIIKSAAYELEERGFIKATGGKYSTLSLCEASREITEGREKIILKINKDEYNTASSKKKKKVSINAKGNELFEILRTLRFSIAREENVPPYIVCSDKTLRDMCIKLPMNKSEMLGVNGIGENKFEKYGARFINAIKEFTGGVKGVLYDEASENENAYTKKSKKSEFILTPEIEEKIVYSEKTVISDFVSHLNSLRDSTDMKKLSTKELGRKLIDEGLLYEIEHDGKKSKRPTQEGLEVGIYTEKRHSQYSGEYEVVCYNNNAQHILAELLKE